MNAKRLFFCTAFVLLSPLVCAAQQTVSEAATSFLPPGTRLAELERFDSNTGNLIEKVPAILTGHFVTSNSTDIVFAYTNTSQDPQAKSLFMTVLHKLPEGYTKVFEKSFYERFLWVQDFRTVGLKIVKMPGESTDSIMFITARGASLGAQVEIYHWANGLGMINVMQPHPSAHKVTFSSETNQFTLTLSFEKYPGEKGVPQPMLFKWDGKELAPSSGHAKS